MSDEAAIASELDHGPLASFGCARFDAGAIGPLWIAWVGEGLVMLHFGGAPPADASRWLPELAAIPERPLPALVERCLARYVAGEPVDPTELPVRLGGTKFQRKVWSLLRRVPRGAVRTYAGLARDAGSPRAMRAVGMAMATNPIAVVVPCHRVVGAGMTLGGFSGGLERKRILLELEGVKTDAEHVLPGQLDLL